ncbi:hypothetical protein [Halogeometricum limi]|uniref:Uncharacterized protein n=1 Tax=Halogeometricum limi TaxID=555875 RepID=A0A1I6IJ78_9EURY|nr:hypothetical protein [Halogeometricum limi]SFR66731.1 hypothetical protein SAMN04488124_3278 [Halogeometricum limi]
MSTFDERTADDFDGRFDERPLPVTLQYLDYRCSRDGIPLGEWLRAMYETGGAVCLRCQKMGVELFLCWDEDAAALREVTRLADGLTLRPTVADPVRTSAMLTVADTIEPVLASETPFATR